MFLDDREGQVDLGRVGLYSGLFRRGVADVPPDVVAEVEHLGYGAVWVPDARGDLSPVEQLAGATRRMVVATGVVSVWTCAAPDLAMAYERVERTAPGRILVGVGISHGSLVERAGHHYDRPLERLTAYLDELDAAEPTIRAARRVIGANGPRMLALAGARTAGAHPYLVTPEHTHQARSILGPRPLLAPEQKVLFEPDPYRARTLARSRLALYFGLPNYVRSWARMGYGEDDLVDGGSDRLIDALVAWGDVDRIATRVREHHAAGADHVAVHVLTNTPAPPIDTWRTLAPALIDDRATS